jgi:hypothetical protein
LKHGIRIDECVVLSRVTNCLDWFDFRHIEINNFTIQLPKCTQRVKINLQCYEIDKENDLLNYFPLSITHLEISDSSWLPICIDGDLSYGFELIKEICKVVGPNITHLKTPINPFGPAFRESYNHMINLEHILETITYKNLW